MNTGLLYAASGVMLLLGLCHSVLGELWLLRPMPRFKGGVGSEAFARGTLRATWHITTALGYGGAVILIRYAQRGEGDPFVVRVVAVTLAVAGIIGFFATRARHPGWIGFFVAAGLAWFAAS